MSVEQLLWEDSLESSREIHDSSNNINGHESLGVESSSQGVDNDDGSFISTAENSANHIEGTHLLEGPNGQMHDAFDGAKDNQVYSDGDTAVTVSGKPTETKKSSKWKKVHIDTTAPFDSVKSAVSKFGGILDWKAHKVQTVERRKVIDEEIEKVQEEIPRYKEQAEIAEQSKNKMLKELENTKRLIEELKISLEKSLTEESQAKQDSELAQLRVEELEKGIAEESSVVVKTQIEVAKIRHEAAITDLKCVDNELESLQNEYASLLAEKDFAVRKAEEAVSASKEMEMTVEKLTVELVSTKESLESANAAHLEAEEQRIGATMAKEQDLFTWDKELMEAQQKLDKLNQQIDSAKELKSNLSTASSILVDLKVELSAYMDSNISQDNDSSDKTHVRMRAEAAAANNELEEVKQNIDKAVDEVNCLKMAATSLKTELEKEKLEIASLRQREGMASIAVTSLEAELDKIRSEVVVVRQREKEARAKMVELPNQLKHVSKETDDAKSVTEFAQQELKRAKEEAELAKAEANTLECRLVAARKEIEAARASERLALAAIKALQESESTRLEDDNDGSQCGITLSLEEYYELSKKAHEAEEQAKMKVAEAMSKIEVAKEDELRSMKQLEDANREIEERKEALRVAKEKAEKAQEGKLGVEQELRKRREEHERRRKAGEMVQGSVDNPTKSTEEGIEKAQNLETTYSSSTTEETDSNETSPKEGYFGQSSRGKKKKKSLFPRFFMFLGKKHSKSSSKT